MSKVSKAEAKVALGLEGHYSRPKKEEGKFVDDSCRRKKMKQVKFNLQNLLFKAKLQNTQCFSVTYVIITHDG